MNFLFPYMARWKALNWTRYHQIFNHLANMGHTVYILQPPAFDSQETNFQEIAADLPHNLHLIDVPLNKRIWNSRLPLNKLIKKGYYSMVCGKRIKEYISQFNIDVLFLYNIPQYPLLRVDNCITIFDVADDYMDMLRYELGILHNPFIMKCGEYIFKKMIERSSITLAVSQVLANAIMSQKTIEVLPNGVDFGQMGAGDAADIREKYKGPVIGFIGSFEYFIDFDLILQAAQRLPEYTFLLVGTGRDAAYVKGQVKERNLRNVILTGGVPHDEVARFIAAMDVCLNIFKKLPISHGACPIKLFEYIAMKKPVITTRLDEIAYIDKEFLFYADTVDELEAQIKRVLSEPEIVTRYVEKGYNIVKAEYSWYQIAKRLLAIVEQQKRVAKT